MRTAMRIDEPPRSDNPLSAYGRARSTVGGAPLSPDELRKTAYPPASGATECCDGRGRCVRTNNEHDDLRRPR
jgi:hypothetical protein